MVASIPSAAARRAVDKRSAEIKFVEDQLKLSEMFETSFQLEQIIATQLEKKSRLLGAIAEINSRIEERERAILFSVTEGWSNEGLASGKLLSQAELERRLKLDTAGDEELLKVKARLVELKIELDVVDLELRSFETQHKGTVGRIKAAASYMDFLRSGRDALSIQLMNSPYGV